MTTTPETVNILSVTTRIVYDEVISELAKEVIDLEGTFVSNFEVLSHVMVHDGTVGMEVNLDFQEPTKQPTKQPIKDQTEQPTKQPIEAQPTVNPTKEHA